MDDAIRFDAVVIEWRGPSPFHFAAIPEALVGEVRHAAREASYGWGAVPVEAEAGGQSFATSLFPRDGGYLLPLKDHVRRTLGIVVGDRVAVTLRVRSRRGSGAFSPAAP
ncbi:DUF1905 domain-containing protein [Sphingomonas sp. 1P06PA]|uniref:DUF1905 domain-containing protein n=1 Tax=Sphingomonas sp. 1P06PA TaxID=554121 RepID=UPI0039A601EF